MNDKVIQQPSIADLQRDAGDDWLRIEQIANPEAVEICRAWIARYAQEHGRAETLEREDKVSNDVEMVLLEVLGEIDELESSVRRLQRQKRKPARSGG